MNVCVLRVYLCVGGLYVGESVVCVRLFIHLCVSVYVCVCLSFSMCSCVCVCVCASAFV